MDSGRWATGPAVTASHPETGRGFTIPGSKDANGRPVILSQGAANSFAAMMRDSRGQVRASDIASAQRSPSKNQAVGGVAGSEHLDGNAMDIHGSSIAWIRKNGAKYGWYVNDYDGSHGGHVEFRGGGTYGATSLPVQTFQSPTTRRGGGMTGLVTYYTGSGGSDGVAGGMTANNKDRFDPNAMTAAVQRSLRGKYLDKWLLVEDLDTGKSVRVYANDVGSMGGTDNSINRQDPRIVDLSPAAFKQLYGSLNRGTGRIRVRIDPNQRGQSPSRVRASAQPNEELGSQLTAQLEAEGGYEDTAGLKPLPIRRMLQQAGRPMSPERRSLPNGPGYWRLEKKDLKIDPARHAETIKRNQQIRSAIDNWNPLAAEDKQRLNNTNPSPRSRMVAPTERQFREALKPQIDAWHREARKGGAFASMPGDVLTENKFDLSVFVDDKTRSALKQQVFLFLDKERGANPDEAKLWDLPKPFLLDLRKLGNDFLYEWNTRRNRRRENTVDMIQMGRDAIRPIDLPGQ